MLGESAHGTAEFSTAKTRLIKFLHREMGFDVVAFESSMSGCDAANRRIGALPPVLVMRSCAFGTWHTQEALGLFEYLDAERRAGRRLDLAGFDIQNSSGYGRQAIAARFEVLLELTAPDLIPGMQVDEQSLGERTGRRDPDPGSRRHRRPLRGDGAPLRATCRRAFRR